MYNPNIARKGFLIFIVLFCAYMQLSPVVDLDYVWINGHEHYIGAAIPHSTGTVISPPLLQSLSPQLEESAHYLPPQLIAQFTEQLVPATTLRL